MTKKEVTAVFQNPTVPWKYDGTFTVKVLADRMKAVRAMLPDKASMKGDTFCINATVESTPSSIRVEWRKGCVFEVRFKDTLEVRNMIGGPLWIKPKT